MNGALLLRTLLNLSSSFFSHWPLVSSVQSSVYLLHGCVSNPLTLDAFKYGLNLALHICLFDVHLHEISPHFRILSFRKVKPSTIIYSLSIFVCVLVIPNSISQQVSKTIYPPHWYVFCCPFELWIRHNVNLRCI